jgi:hypothetical protein
LQLRLHELDVVVPPFADVPHSILLLRQALLQRRDLVAQHDSRAPMLVAVEAEALCL